MLFVTLLVGEVINASTCRHVVIEPVRSIQLVGEVINASTCRHVVIEPVRSTQLVGVIHQQIVALLVGIIHWP
ncbi:hypothetical protein SLEP1_g34178 [Rubroshorea leprosula]|uniref:Secreted protein n=1 Tax=Rubroshorea leprosula TaxID=152421 RepID=A0AAV5KIZ9_9ROSI|nr:hypothetical protein SLEP1_g34178 [Rubroshorea leprosula]